MNNRQMVEMSSLIEQEVRRIGPVIKREILMWQEAMKPCIEAEVLRRRLSKGQKALANKR